LSAASHRRQLDRSGRRALACIERSPSPSGVARTRGVYSTATPTAASGAPNGEGASPPASGSPSLPKSNLEGMVRATLQWSSPLWPLTSAFVVEPIAWRSWCSKSRGLLFFDKVW